MNRPNLEQYLEQILGDALPGLWEEWLQGSGAVDLDRFVLWLCDGGHLTVEQRQRVLLSHRLEVTGASGGDATATFGDAWASSDGVADPASSWEAGTTVLSLLGRGAMGEVILVRDDALRRKMARKSLAMDMVGNQDAVQRFVAEAQISAQLDHPNIISVHQLAEDEHGRPSYTMKLIQGETLAALIARQASHLRRGDPVDVPVRERLEVFLKVCDAVSYAHDRGVLHRDLKPENIMIGPFGEVVVMDWGIARVIGAPEEEFETLSGLDEAVSGAMVHTRVGQVLGTPNYMSPEQALARHHLMDGRSDLFSLGLILWELLTLKRAYSGRDLMTLLETAQRGLVPDVRESADESVARELAGIVRKATRPDLDGRYDDVASFARDIRLYIAGHAPLGVPDNVLQASTRWLSRNRTWMAITLLGLFWIAVLAVVGGVAEVQRQQVVAEQERVAAVHLVGAVARHGHGVDAELQRYAGLVEHLAAEARARLRSPPQPHPVLLTTRFDAGPTPDGAAYHGRYFQDVHLGQPGSKLAPGVLPGDHGTELEQLAATGPAFREVFLRSAGEGTLALPAAQREELLLEGQTPFVWAYIATETGIHTSYPGHGGYPAEYDPRQRPWYLEARDKYGPHWGSPYVDISGLGLLLPCNMTVRDAMGNLLGVVGAELTFGRVIRDLLIPSSVRGAEASYLVDARGQIVVSSKDKGQSALQSRDLSQGAELVPFPSDPVVRAMRESRAGSLELQGRTYAWTRLLTIDWSYVVEGRVGEELADIGT